MTDRAKLPVRLIRWQRAYPYLREWCSKIRTALPIATGAMLVGAYNTAQCATTAHTPQAMPSESARCLADGRGYLRARLSGSIRAELNWRNQGLECTGGTRPGSGARMRFSHLYGRTGHKLVLVFGVSRLREGQSGKELPVNVTVILEGTGQFYGTRGEERCTLDRVRQEAIAGIPQRKRSYRVVARGFCSQPARAIAGKGAILLTRFDFAGRIDFDAEEPAPNAEADVRSIVPP